MHISELHDSARVARKIIHSGLSELPYVDIQKVAMSHTIRTNDNADSTTTGSAHMLGLAAVTRQWLQRTLDKAEQCSDWDARPLSKRQLHYAACDAAVLIDIAEAMGLSSISARSQEPQRVPAS